MAPMFVALHVANPVVRFRELAGDAPGVVGRGVVADDDFEIRVWRTVRLAFLAG